MTETPDWLETGENAWRVAQANRFAVLMENEAYFDALAAALKKARRSVTVLGWQFDPRTRLDAETRPDDRQAEIGHLLRLMIKENPDLDVRLLIWRSPLLIAASQGFFPQRAQRWFRKRIADFRLDRPGPLGACHHQKVVVIDDRLAFCGGGDISVDRWDSPLHLDGDPRRCEPSGVIPSPRHEVMAMMDGEAAEALGDLARGRWLRATGERVSPVRAETDPWPDHVAPTLTHTPVAIARTVPKRRGRDVVCESQQMHVAAICAARKLIYLENQYFTSPLIANCLADRLVEPDGPEIVLVSTLKAPSWFDQMTMDKARAEVLHKLEQADLHDRLTAFAPLSEGGDRIIVHSKVSIIDDEIIRIGSTNLNNRSLGYDTECDVAAFPPPDQHDAIRRFRHHLIGHFLGVDDTVFAACEALSPSVGHAILTFGGDRLKQIGMDRPSMWQRAVAEFQLGDPHSPDDSWRPWRRRRASEIGPGIRAARASLGEPDQASAKSITSGR